MKIIMLNGDSRRGKTTTLKMVCTNLVNLGANLVNQTHHINTYFDDWEYELQYNGKNVVIYTAGDNEWFDCVNTIVKYADRDVLIFACSNFATLPQIIQRHLHIHHFLQKTLANPPTVTEQAANQQDCNTITGWV